MDTSEQKMDRSGWGGQGWIVVGLSGQGWEAVDRSGRRAGGNIDRRACCL